MASTDCDLNDVFYQCQTCTAYFTSVSSWNTHSTQCSPKVGSSLRTSSFELVVLPHARVLLRKLPPEVEACLGAANVALDNDFPPPAKKSKILESVVTSTKYSTKSAEIRNARNPFVYPLEKVHFKNKTLGKSKNRFIPFEDANKSSLTSTSSPSSTILSEDECYTATTGHVDIGFGSQQKARAFYRCFRNREPRKADSFRRLATLKSEPEFEEINQRPSEKEYEVGSQLGSFCTSIKREDNQDDENYQVILIISNDVVSDEDSSAGFSTYNENVSSLSFPSSSSFTSFENSSFSNYNTSNKRQKRMQGRPINGSCKYPDDKHERRKERNKRAASRYRMKQQQQQDLLRS